MRRNRLRELLRAGRPTLGTHIHSAWPAVVELAGHAGVFDYVEFAGEYAPYDLFALENLGRAVNTFDHMSAMFKVEQQPRTYLAVRAIGSGIQNVLFADPRTPDDVRECVKSVRAETPVYLDLGVRHFCMGWDVSVLFDYFKTEGGALRDLLGAG
jgi:4-hydroxy-2-oxoheptanedioate aldolase